MMSECGVARQMSKTFSQPGLEFQLVNNDWMITRPAKRREPLVLKSKLRNFVDTTGDLCFTNLIISGLLVRLILLLVTSILTNQEAVLRRFCTNYYDYFMQQQG